MNPQGSEGSDELVPGGQSLRLALLPLPEKHPGSETDGCPCQSHLLTWREQSGEGELVRLAAGVGKCGQMGSRRVELFVQDSVG